ncbi:Synaptotagmin 1 [Portunus trituberculatus]|uniref:Synaptotagmin 1 n=1 Tax=Portunus trituberculatus TaxID=210409 RepID=A0A5B7DKT2_PORTR|nr:Synaptotagmin 1 [Portunus trituberculatus]
MSKTLVFGIYDFDRFSKHDQIGEVKIPLCQVDLAQTIEEWRDLVSVEGDGGQRLEQVVVGVAAGGPGSQTTTHHSAGRWGGSGAAPLVMVALTASTPTPTVTIRHCGGMGVDQSRVTLL